MADERGVDTPQRTEDEELRASALENVGSIARARRRAEEDLRSTRNDLAAANERLTLILESINDGFVVLDSEWRFAHVNARAEEIMRPLGHTREALLGRVVWEAIPDLVGTQVETEYRRAVDTQAPADFEHYYAPLASWFRVRAFPSRAGLSVFFLDITARKNAEALLAAERGILSRIAADDGLPAILEAIAREVEQRSTDGLLCTIGGHGIGTAAAGRGTPRFDGEPAWVEDIRSAAGEVLGTIAMRYRVPRSPGEQDRRLIELARDMAAIAIERDRAQSALRSSEARLRASFEQAAVGIATADTEGRFLEMNRKFCELLGYSAEELRRMTFRDITHPDDLAATSANVAQVLAGDRGDYTMEKRYRRKDGGVFWSQTTVTLIRGPSGEPLRFVGVIEDVTARKETEEALRQSEEFGRGVLESSLDCIKTLELDGTLTWINERGCQALCIDDPSVVVGRNYVELWDGEERERARAAVQAAASGRNGSLVGYFPVKGEPRWWSVVITPMRDARGRVAKLLAVSRDVTDRVVSERQAREGEERLRQLANSIPQLAWMAEPDGDIFWYNERWFAYTGTTLEQMRGWGWQSVHDPAMLPQVLERWRASLAAGTPFEMEFPLRSASGEMRWFLTRVHPLRDEDGRVVRWFGTNTDIEDARRARMELEAERGMLELLNRTGTALASNLNLQELLQTVTDSATRLSGAQFGAFFYNVTNDAGQSYQLFTLSGAPREAFAKLGMPRATGLFGTTFRGEGVVRCDDVTADPRYGQSAPHHGMPVGHLPVRSYLAVPVVSRSGEVIGGLFFGHSSAGVFTERIERLVVGIAAHAAIAVDNARLFQAAAQAAKEREALLESERAARSEAERAGHMKDEFLATLSHELRTPLSAILGWAHLMRTRTPKPEELAKAMEIVERNARLQAQLVEDLLDMSRITSGKLRLDVQPLMPSAPLEAAIETIRPAAEAKGIRLQKTLDYAAGPIAADGARLQQVAWNLLNNAIKFTPRGGRVHVVLARVESNIEISVSDTGAGIEPEFLEHVFERFRQADASTTRQHGGLGLGLSIVRRLVEMHGGTVEARSEGSGKGATFVVRLPLVAVHRWSEPRQASHPRAMATAPAAFEPVDLTGVRVLVVDDQPDASDLVARVLGECGADVVTADGAEAGLRSFEARRPDVIVSDIGMPGTDGYELMRRVRALEGTGGRQTPAIAMTAFARSEDRTRALHAGFQVHIAKPVEPAELVATVASVIGRVGRTG